jgi:phosphoesterase RecJ-like protein
MTISETARWLYERDNFLVLTHRRPDGDTLGCAAGLVQGLIRAGKTAYILNNPEATARYTTYVEKHWAPEGFRPSQVIAVDIASPELFPVTGTSYADKVDLCIDHHPSNSLYADLLCLDTTKSSCGEIIFELLMELSGSLDSETATSLYVAVSTDTGCFQYGNTNSNTLRTAAALVDAGAPIGELNRELFRKKAKSRVLLEAMITSGMEFYFDGAVAIAMITRDMMTKTGAGENEMDDVAAIPGSIEEVIVGITIREMTGPCDCKVSVRTTPLVNASDLCAQFGGGGHAMAAGFSLAVTAEETKKLLLEALDSIFPIRTPEK